MTDFNSKRSGFGTKEWAEHNFNIGTGCRHSCRYCYARHNALKHGIIKDASEWKDEKVTIDFAKKKFSRHNGIVMFPTQHDITPTNINACIDALTRMLEIGDRVLIVSKPNLDCTKLLCEKLIDFQEQIMFRFTIGSNKEDVCRFWEPGAPSPEERIKSLKLAFDMGYETSVSAEPMLEGYNGALALYDAVIGYITNDIWFGKMNFPRQRVDVSVAENLRAVERVEIFQSNDEIRCLYEHFKDNPKVAWKESVKKVVGI